jgi:hypothetical protein
MTRGGAREQLAVPRADFRSYYGRAVLKTPVWEWKIAAYLFAGGLSAGSALLAAGADLSGRPSLRRTGRVGALASLAASMYFLVSDLGRPFRFHHMLRVAKPSSPMSVGTWILVAYGPGAGLAGLAELMPAALRRAWAGRLVSPPVSPPTPRSCCHRPPFPPGARRTRTCRSSSPARRPRAAAGWACC